MSDPLSTLSVPVLRELYWIVEQAMPHPPERNIERFRVLTKLRLRIWLILEGMA